VLNPAASEPHVLVAFNAPSLAKFAPTVKEGGFILYDSTIIEPPAKDLAPGRTFVGVPFTQLARDLGKPMVKNVVALGALQAITEVLPSERLLNTLRHVLKDKPDLIHLNEAAFVMGQRHAAPVKA
jgi:Pyruvate/2-oxoacid:ferredoxin oxidoreductase gamma subunit